MSLLSLATEDMAGSGLDLNAHEPHVSLVNYQTLEKIFSDSTLFKKSVQESSSPPAGALSFTYYALDTTCGSLSPTDYARYKIYWGPLKGFAAACKDKRGKYLQPPGTDVRLYVPPTLDWSVFIQDVTIPLVVVEGEKKALALADRGVHAVAVGGVYNFSNRKRGERILPEFKGMCKGSRSVYIVFDVDKGYTTMKPEVSRAAHSLAAWLIDFSGRPRIVTLPSDGSRKMAVDDWLLENKGYSYLDCLVGFSKSSVESAASKALYEEAERYTYIHGTDLVGDNRSRKIHPKSGYLTTRRTEEVIVEVTTMVKDKTTSAWQAVRLPTVKKIGEAFLEWPSRPTAREVAYIPGNPAALTEDGFFNEWRGWAQTLPEQVTEEDVAPMREAMQYMYKEDWEEMWNWFLLPLARPGVQQVIMPVIQSPRTGTGKSAIPTFFVKYVYGAGEGTPDNAVILNSTSLQNKRLEFLVNKQFVLVDDANDTDRAMQDLIKGLVTNGTTFIDRKYIAGGNKKIHANWTITSNREAAVRVDDPNDRRAFFVATSEEQSEEVSQFWDNLHKWGANENGGGKLIKYAQTLFQHECINENRSAPMTHKKAALIGLARGEAENEVFRLVQLAEEGWLNRTILSVKELKEWLLEHTSETDVRRLPHTLGLSSYLNLAGARRYEIPHGSEKTRQVRLSKGALEVVYILAGFDKWCNALPEDIRSEFKAKPQLKEVVKRHPSAVKDDEVVPPKKRANERKY